MKLQVPAAQAALTVNGTATGFITVGSDAPFYVGAECWLKNDNGSQRCLITELAGAGVIGLRFLDEENRGNVATRPNYGRSNCSAYTTATNSKLFQPQQYVNVDAVGTKPTIL